MLSINQESYESTRLACGLEAQIKGFTQEIGQEYFEMFMGLVMYNFAAEYCSLAHYGFMLEYMEKYTVKACLELFSALGELVEERLSDVNNDIPKT